MPHTLQIEYAAQQAAATAIRRGKGEIDSSIAALLSRTSAFRENSLGAMRDQFESVIADMKTALDGYCDTLLTHAGTTESVSQMFDEVDVGNAKRLGA